MNHTTCLIEMAQVNRNEVTLKEACKYIYPATRPKFSARGQSLSPKMDGQEQGRTSIATGNNKAALKFRKLLIAATNCFEGQGAEGAGIQNPHPTSPNAKWPTPPLCTAGEKGTDWGPNRGARDGFHVGIPFAQSHGHLQIVRAFDELLKSEPTLLLATTIEKSRKIALHQCVKNPADVECPFDAQRPRGAQPGAEVTARPARREGKCPCAGDS